MDEGRGGMWWWWWRGGGNAKTTAQRWGQRKRDGGGRAGISHRAHDAFPEVSGAPPFPRICNALAAQRAGWVAHLKRLWKDKGKGRGGETDRSTRPRQERARGLNCGLLWGNVAETGDGIATGKAVVQWRSFSNEVV